MAKDLKELTETAKKVIRIEAAGVSELASRIGESFGRSLELILSARGKVAVSGMGKSGLICQKIAATLASTGTSSFFLHPAEGAHGDLGMLGKDDILIAVSNSGETEEIIRMLPYVKRMGIKIIAMTGGLESTLSKNSDEVLDIAVTEEACPMGLAPTASTTATLAMGDALAVALLEAKDFKEEDFAVLHPAGSLGRKLLKVSDLMHKGEEIPRVAPDVIVKDALFMMTEKRLGLTGVFEGTNLVGVITDGDIRRTLEKGESVLSMRAGDIMGAAPKTILDGELAEKAISVMEKFSITALFALDNRGNVTGVVHLHDLLRAGVV